MTCGGQGGNGTVILQVFQFLSVSIVLPILDTHSGTSSTTKS